MPTRLFWKIFVSLWLAIVAIALTVDWIVDAMFQHELRATPELSVGYRAELASGLVAMSLTRDGVEATRSLFNNWSGKRPLPVMVVDDEGRDLIDRTVAAEALMQARQLLKDNPGATAVHEVRALDGRQYLLFVPLPMLPATPPSVHVYQAKSSLLAEFSAMTLLSLLFAIGLSWYLYRPIRHLHEANRRFAAGDMGTRIGPLIGNRSDEVTDLARDFDEMASCVEATVSAKTRLLHDVSHELRAPLARMHVALALMRRSPEKAPEMLDRMGYEIDRFDRTLSETLSLSRLESNAPVTDEECVNLVELLEDIVSDAQFEAGFSRNRIELEAQGTVLIKGRSELLRRALENVIRNGIVHTPAAAPLHVRVIQEAAGMVRVSVCDHGGGIPEDELTSVFEPFFRGRGAVSAAGHGLGLSIVRRAVEAHGGRVSAANLEQGGLCVTLELPVMTLET
ncbi:ATP-binding protein [Rhodocyclaceae bacterium SMB388]